MSGLTIFIKLQLILYLFSRKCPRSVPSLCSHPRSYMTSPITSFTVSAFRSSTTLTLQLALLKVLPVPLYHPLNKLPKKLTVIRKVQVSISVFFELFQWPIVYIPVLVLHHAIGLDESIDPLCADCFILETKHTLTVKLLIAKSALI